MKAGKHQWDAHPLYLPTLFWVDRRLSVSSLGNNLLRDDYNRWKWGMVYFIFWALKQLGKWKRIKQIWNERRRVGKYDVLLPASNRTQNPIIKLYFMTASLCSVFRKKPTIALYFTLSSSHFDTTWNCKVNHLKMHVSFSWSEWVND